LQAQFQKAAPLNSVPGHMVADILALNKIRRHLADTSAAWDTRLHNLSCSLHLRQQQTRSSDPGFLDSSLLLFKVGNASFGRSRDAETSLTTKEEPIISANVEMGTSIEQEHVGNSAEHTIDRTTHKQQNVDGTFETSGDSGIAGDDVVEIFSSSVASSDVAGAHFPRNLTNTSVSGVHPLLLDEPEESPVTDFITSLSLPRQSSSPFPIAGALEDLASSGREKPVQEGFRGGSEGMLALCLTPHTSITGFALVLSPRNYI